MPGDFISAVEHSGLIRTFTMTVLEKAVADGVNVGNEVFLIDTKVTQAGGQLQAEQLVEKVRSRFPAVPDQGGEVVALHLPPVAG